MATSGKSGSGTIWVLGFNCRLRTAVMAIGKLHAERADSEPFYATSQGNVFIFYWPGLKNLSFRVWEATVTCYWTV